MKGIPTKKTIATTGLILAVLLVLIPVSLSTGPADLSLRDIPELLKSTELTSAKVIIQEIRLPRMVLAFIVGAALAMSGAVFQGLLINPLAGPFTLGISSGSAFGASLAILFGMPFWGVPGSAMLGAGLALFIVFQLSGSHRNLEPRSLVLAGIVVGSILSAAISLVKTLSGDSLSSIVFWIMGSLAGRGWNEIRLCLPYLIPGMLGMLVYARDLDLLSLGADQAHTGGIDVKRSRLLLLFFASITAAAAVSVSGIIGFVGLVVPHALRILLGPGHRRLLILSPLLGGTMLLGGDTLARALSGNGEIPVGVVAALIGGPLFCLLLRQREQERGKMV